MQDGLNLIELIGGPFLLEASGSGGDFRRAWHSRSNATGIKRPDVGEANRAEYGIGLAIGYRARKPTRSRLIRWEPTDLLELIGSFRLIGQAQTIIDEHLKAAMIDDNLARMRTHRNAIQRHRRLLETQLTEHERQYVCRRLSEEESALESLRVVTFPMVFTESSGR